MSNVFQRAKVIRMNGEPWQNAVQRATSQLRYEQRGGQRGGQLSPFADDLFTAEGPKSNSPTIRHRGPRHTIASPVAHADGRTYKGSKSGKELCYFKESTGRCRLSARGRDHEAHQAQLRRNPASDKQRAARERFIEAAASTRKVAKPGSAAWKGAWGPSYKNAQHYGPSDPGHVGKKLNPSVSDDIRGGGNNSAHKQRQRQKQKQKQRQMHQNKQKHRGGQLSPFADDLFTAEGPKSNSPTIRHRGPRHTIASPVAHADGRTYKGSKSGKELCYFKESTGRCRLSARGRDHEAHQAQLRRNPASDKQRAARERFIEAAASTRKVAKPGSAAWKGAWGPSYKNAQHYGPSVPGHVGKKLNPSVSDDIRGGGNWSPTSSTRSSDFTSVSDTTSFSSDMSGSSNSSSLW